MTDNPHVKSLKPFDPKKDLIVNEKFSAEGIGATADALSDLEFEETEDEAGADAGKEFCRFKTGGSIQSGLIKVEAESNKSLILGNEAGEIILLDPTGGSLKPLLKFKISGSIIQKPGYSNGIIYCATREGLLYAVNIGLNAQSDYKPIKPEVVWQKRMGKGILTEPIATGKILIVATLGGLYAYEAYCDDSTKAIGKQLWQNPMDGIVASPRIHSGVIYVGSEDKHLYAFEYGGSKISTIWKYRANESIRAKPYVSLNDRYVLTASNDGSVYCIEKNSGRLRWIFIVKSPVYSSIVSAVIGNKEFFYFGSDNGLFYCIDALGKKVWELKTAGKIRSEAIISGGTVYFGSADNNLYALNAKTGKMTFKFSTDGNINGAPVIIDNVIYFGSTDSFVHGVQI